MSDGVLYDEMIGVARLVTTANDASRVYETRLWHPDYNAGHAIVVGNARSIDEAVEMHTDWANLIAEGDLPDEIYDEDESAAAAFADREQGTAGRIHKRAYRDSLVLPTRADWRVPLGFIGVALLVLFLFWLLQ